MGENYCYIYMYIWRGKLFKLVYMKLNIYFEKFIFYIDVFDILKIRKIGNYV